MKVTIRKDGVTAKDQYGNAYSVNGLVVKKQHKNDVFYSIKDRFFKIACPYNTEHEAIVLGNGKINLL